MRREAYVGNLLPLAFDRAAQVLLDQAHGCHSVGTEGLHYLKRRHEAVGVNVIKYLVQFVASFRKDLGRRREVRQSRGVQFWLLQPVLVEGFDGSGRVLGTGI